MDRGRLDACKLGRPCPCGGVPDVLQVPFLDAKGQNFVVSLPLRAIQSTSGLDKKNNVVPQIPNSGNGQHRDPIQGYGWSFFPARRIQWNRFHEAGNTILDNTHF